MRPINAYFEDLPVEYGDYSHLRYCFTELPQFLFSFDLQDGYLHFGVAEEAQQHFQFNI